MEYAIGISDSNQGSGVGTAGGVKWWEMAQPKSRRFVLPCKMLSFTGTQTI